jgi:DNA-binding CsgD family transcriptional regulator
MLAALTPWSPARVLLGGTSGGGGLDTRTTSLQTCEASIPSGTVPGELNRRTVEVPVISAREREVLRLLADGLVISQIARRLFVSESTTKTHVANIYDKLGASNRAQAIMAGRRLGLIDDDDGGALVPARPQPKPPTLPSSAVALEPPPRGQSEARTASRSPRRRRRSVLARRSPSWR